MIPSYLPRKVLLVEDDKIPALQVEAALAEASSEDGVPWELKWYQKAKLLLEDIARDREPFQDVAVALIDHGLDDLQSIPGYESPYEIGPGESFGGFQLAHWLRKQFPDIYVVFRSAQLSPRQREIVQREIAHFEVLTKGSNDRSDIIDCVSKLWERWARNRRPGVPDVVAGYPLDYIAPARLPVLIVGGCGTGKSTFARIIHDNSGRPEGAFFKYTCRDSADMACQGDLFGRVAPGPASELGAVARALGLRPTRATAQADSYEEMVLSSIVEGEAPHVVEPEDGDFSAGHHVEIRTLGGERLQGTLFIERIELLPGMAQAALIELVDHGILQPEGSVGPRFKVDVRVITSSTLDREELRKALDPQLVERLAGWVVKLPDLKEQVDHALEIAAGWTRAYYGPGSEGLTLSDGAREALRALIVEQGWFDEPLTKSDEHEGGNFRGLRRLIERACAVAARGAHAPDTLTAEHIELACRRYFIPLPADPPPISTEETLELAVALSELVGRSSSVINLLSSGQASETDLQDYAIKDANFVLGLAQFVAAGKARGSLNVERWASEPERALSRFELDLNWEGNSKRHWRWCFLLAVLLVSTLDAYRHTAGVVAKLFVPEQKSTLQAAFRTAYMAFFLKGKVGLEFDKKARGKSILLLLDLHLRNDPSADEGDVILKSKVPEHKTYWDYIKRVYNLAWPKRLQRLEPTPTTSPPNA